MYFKQFKLEGMGCASYLIGSKGTGEAAVVDPGWNVEDYLKEAQANNLRITHIFETHLHADHVSGNQRLARATGATIYLHKQAQATFPYQPLEDGTVIPLGEVTIKILHTPGHTWESITLFVEDTTQPTLPPRLLSGDTLFVGDVGRPDFAGQEGAATLYESLQHQILPLPANTEVYPAHLAGSLCGRNLSPDTMSILSREKLTNPALSVVSREEFVKFLTADLPPEPPDFRRIVELNRTGAPSYEVELTELDWSKIQKLTAEGAELVDIREPDFFWVHHLPGSINVSLSLSQFGATTAAFVPSATPVILIASDPGEIEKAQTALGVVGRYNLAGYLIFERVKDYARSNDNKRVSTPHLASLTLPFVLDVREPAEFALDALPDALNLPLRQLSRRLAELESYKQTPLVVICASGYRSSTAASYLEKSGWQKVTNLKGGMTALKAQPQGASR